MPAAPELTVRRTGLAKAAPDGLLAAFILSMLATAGLFYVNIMAAIVDGLKVGLGIEEALAGQIGSSNTAGAAVGAFVAVFFVKRIAWRPAAVLALFGLIAVDLTTTLLRDPYVLMGIRFAHGFVGGWLIGIAFSVIARTKTPDRTFGMLLVVQFGLGGLGLLYLPQLALDYGTNVLFYALAAFSAVTLLLVPFLSDYPRPAPRAATDAAPAIRWVPLGAALIGLFLFQAANMALAAYIFGIGKRAGHDLEFISNTLAWANWIATLGSVLVIALGIRFGRFLPLLVGLVVTVAGNWAFHFSNEAWIYVGANIVTGVTWAFVIPYLLGLCAAFDAAGQTAAIGGFFSKMGLAAGPFIGSFLLSDGDYGLLIDIAAVTLIVCSIAALIPASMLDRTRARGAAAA